MKSIFEQRSFDYYSNVELASAMSNVLQHSTSYGYSGKTTVFISHKHDDLEDLKGVLGFLERNYNVKVYIDSQDLTMPKKTSGQTATNIKNRIKQCDKFILLATNNAIESKWCNWELGYGDANKYRQNIAIFPLKPKGAFDSQYKGHEYMEIYPYITYSDGSEFYKDGTPIKKGYYIHYFEEGNSYITSLDYWFKNK